LTLNRKSAFFRSSHAKAQTKADPQHGLLIEEPNMTATNRTARPWMPEELETVRTRWAEGRSANEIAVLLRGRSRNCIIGIVHRRGYVRSPDAGRVRIANRRAVVVPTSLGEPAPITLAGPAWSHPARAG
jgi:hypothetical protein